MPPSRHTSFFGLDGGIPICFLNHAMRGTKMKGDNIMSRIIEIHTINSYGENIITTYKCSNLADAMLWIECYLQARVELQLYKPIKFKTYKIPFDID